MVVVEKWATEARDATDLRLPGEQDARVSAVAAAAAQTIVALETAGPVVTP